jgi:hypothetical protein
MTKNIGRIDALVRLTVAILLLLAAAALDQRPFLTIAASLAGLLVLSTAISRFCPLYTAFRITTTRTKGI